MGTDWLAREHWLPRCEGALNWAFPLSDVGIWEWPLLRLGGGCLCRRQGPGLSGLVLFVLILFIPACADLGSALRRFSRSVLWDSGVSAYRLRCAGSTPLFFSFLPDFTCHSGGPFLRRVDVRVADVSGGF